METTTHCIVGNVGSAEGLPVNFRHQTSYLSHVFTAVRIKSQFDNYYTGYNTTEENCVKWSELNGEFQMFHFDGEYSFLIHKAHLVKCWKFLIQFR